MLALIVSSKISLLNESVYNVTVNLVTKYYDFLDGKLIVCSLRRLLCIRGWSELVKTL